jgi:threo-3-hydroxy-L-aspartate ammonia-lyase
MIDIDLAAVSAAAERISGMAVRTPLLSSPALDAQVGGNVLLKAENLQRSGSFKFRGAYNRLAALQPSESAAGVVAWSSGNHAQGVAAAAQILGIKAAIIMPSDAPEIKVENTRGYGAEVIFYDRYTESREEISYALARKRGAVVVPSFDDPYIIAGQGTVGLEIAEQAKTAGRNIDILLCCCGGGGLIAGTSIAVRALSPATEIFSVEPASFDDTARSLVAGKRLSNPPEARSICDALLAPEPGELTFPINQTLLAAGLSVTDDEVKSAMAYAFRVLKLVVEPGGVVALAALLSGKIDVTGKTVVAVLSGGNVDPHMFSDVISSTD